MRRRDFLIGAGLLTAGSMVRAQAPATTFQSDRISVTTQGSGPAVVLVHGLGSSPRVWRNLVDTVTGFTWHLVQVKGFAGTAAEGNAGTEGPVAAPVAEEIARLIGTLPGGRAALIGHSMGGSIGMMVAARHPERVTRLMVVDMFPFMGALFMPNATPEAVRPMAEQFRRGITDTPADAYRQQVTQTIAGMIQTESFRAETVAESVGSDRNVSGRSMAELITTDLRPELGNIRAPTVVLYARGEGAPISAEQLDIYYRAAYANLAGARLHRVPNSAHFIMYDQPAEFVREVRAFLAG